MKSGKASIRGFNEYNRKKYFPGVCFDVHFMSPLIIETIFEQQTFKSLGYSLPGHRPRRGQLLYLKFWKSMDKKEGGWGWDPNVSSNCLR